MINFDPGTIAPFFRYRQTSFGAGTAAGTVIASANSQRIALLISTGTNSTLIQAGSVGSFTSGISVPSNSIPLLLKFSELGSYVQQDWYNNVSLSADLFVVEVFFSPVVG